MRCREQCGEGETWFLRLSRKLCAVTMWGPGLHAYVEEAEILKVINSEGEARAKVYELIEKANEAGGIDNVSVILLEKEEGELHG